MANLKKQNTKILANSQSRESLNIDEIRRNIFSYSLDLSIDTIMQQIKDEEINLKSVSNRPIYQRKYFWNDQKASRLVESVLLNVPIPSCYFAQDNEGIYDVIDGQQRILSLYRYLGDKFALKGLEKIKEIEGLKYSKLPLRLKRMIRLHILRCVVIAAESDEEVKFDVFERLNSDATPLRPQELRNCIFRGHFNNMLSELASEELWLKIRNRNEPDGRLADEEIILRFFSFILKNRDEYKPPLKHWLNSTASEGMKLDESELIPLRNTWHETLNKVLEWFDPIECFRRPNEKMFNRSLFDLITYTARNSDIKKIRKTRSEFRKRFNELLEQDEFERTISGPLASKEVTTKRITLWENKFSDLGL